MNVIAIANQKGGAGKTTLTQNLAAVLSELALRVLMIDLDQQASLSICWGCAQREPNMADVFLGNHAVGRDWVQEIAVEVDPGRFPDLYLAPGHSRLALAATALRELALGHVALHSHLLRHGYDAVLIDCPPALDLLTVNALVAADSVLIPMVPETLNVEGLAQIVGTIREVNQKLRPALRQAPLRILSVVPNRYDPRLVEHRRVVAKLGRLAAAPCSIGNTIRVAEAQRERLPLIAFDRANPQTHAFYQLGEWVAAWLRTTKH